MYHVWECASQALTACALQDLAATAISGGQLPDEVSPEEMAGDYSWDCEYNFDLHVRAAICRRQPQRRGRSLCQAAALFRQTLPGGHLSPPFAYC